MYVSSQNDALGTKANVATVTLTPVVNTQVNASRANFIVFGKFVSYSIALSISATQASGTNFFILPAGYLAATTQDIPIHTKSGGTATLYASGRNIVSNGAISAGEYFANGVFVIQ